MGRLLCVVVCLMAGCDAPREVPCEGGGRWCDAICDTTIRDAGNIFDAGDAFSLRFCLDACAPVCGHDAYSRYACTAGDAGPTSLWCYRRRQLQ